jgi:hypothetical protein
MRAVAAIAAHVIEREQEFRAGRARALQRVRQTRREVPQVAGLHVGNLRPPLFVEDRDPAFAVEHDGPFGLLVPVPRANAVAREPHVHTRDVGRDREVGLRDSRAQPPFW